MGSSKNPDPQAAMDQIRATIAQNRPDYTRLFGSQDLCDCEHCRSVYSPAAYLVELLQFLDPKLPGNAITPLDILIGNKNKTWPEDGSVVKGRRPDIAHIKLSCENTNTTLPYVDLVNEVLESYVAFDQSLPLKTDTDDKPVSPEVNAPNESSPGVTSLELGANPEHTNKLAYKQLLDAQYPFQLPFHQPLESLRLTLDQMGSSRQELMRVFGNSNDAISQKATDLETLRISEADYVILTGEKLDGTPQAFAVASCFGFDGTPSKQTPWVQGAIPTGGIPALYGGDTWTFALVNPPPPSGIAAHVSAPLPGLHVHYFHSVPSNDTLLIGPEDILTTEVFLDPANPPQEVMLQWNDTPGDEGGWEHRAYWSSSKSWIEAGVEGTASRRFRDQLPPLGTWVTLEVPAYWVGLAGRPLHGMSFTLFGGSALWGASGKRSATWVEQLSHVPVFLSRTGVSYEELIEMLRTRFINPHLPIDPEGKIDPAKADQVLVLDAPDSVCDLYLTRLQHLDGSLPTDTDWSRLHRFIRLWRRSGWSIQDLDRAFLALQISDITPTFIQQLSQVLQVQRALNLDPQQVLSFWGAVPTTGQNSLYEKLFLNKAVRAIDSVFQPSAGAYLADTNERLNDHLPALLAGLRCRAADLDLMRVHCDLADDKAPLTLATVTALYRYVTLARATKLAIGDLIDLEEITALHPFSKFSPGLQGFDSTDIEPARTLSFLQILQALSGSDWSPAKLNYLFSDQFHAPAAAAPSAETIRALFVSIREGLAAIAADHTATNDPLGELTKAKLTLLIDSPSVQHLSDGIAGGQFNSVPLDELPAGVSLPVVSGHVTYESSSRRLITYAWIGDAELNLLKSLSNQISYLRAIQLLADNQKETIKHVLESALSWPTAIGDLEPIWKAADEIAAIDKGMRSFAVPLSILPAGVILPPDGKIRYDNALNELQTRSLLSASELEAILTLSNDNNFITAVKTLQGQVVDWVVQLYEQELQWGSSADIREAISLGNTIKVRSLLSAGRYRSFLQKALPFIRKALSRRLVLQQVGEAFKLEPSTTAFLLEGPEDDQEMCPLTSSENNQKPAIADFLALIGDGLTVSTFTSEEWNGTETESPDPDPGINHRWEGKHGFSVRWQGSLVSNKNERYQFRVRVGGSVDLKIGGETLLSVKEGQQVVEYTVSKDLLAGERYAIHVDFTNHSAEAVLELRWSGPSTPLEIVPAYRLFSSKRDNPMVAAEQTYLRLHKVSLMIEGFQLQRRELAVLTVPSHPSGLDLNTIPVQKQLVDPNRLFQQWKRWHAFSELRALSRIRPDLLPDVLITKDANQAKASLAEAMGWNPKILDLVVGLDGFNWKPEENQSSEALLGLAKAMGLLASLAAPALEVFHWAKSTPSFDQFWGAAQQAKRALKSRYDNEAWAEVAKPMTNRLRELQRSALVAYLVPRLGFQSSDDLFSYFLIDVDMSACFQTSRIKQAISSVQLFIQSCQMNLVPEVSPSMIDRDRWKWMQNYRIWEANLKVYLYPENWIEPELRDDKSPFFRELESELLQSELSGESSDFAISSAEIAITNYLQKMETISRLKVCGMKEQSFFGDTTDKLSVLHVFAHTFSMPRCFYYRQRVTVSENYYYWIPWEKVPLEIEADEVLPVIWNRRLYLFWQVQFSKNVPDGPTNDPPKKKSFVRLAWSTYQNHKWSAKQLVDVSKSIDIGQGEPRLYSPSHWLNFDENPVLRIYISSATPSFLVNLEGYKVSNFGRLSFRSLNDQCLKGRVEPVRYPVGFVPTQWNGKEEDQRLGFRKFEDITPGELSDVVTSLRSEAEADDEITTDEAITIAAAVLYNIKTEFVPVLNKNNGHYEIFQTGVQPFSLNDPFFLRNNQGIYLVWPRSNVPTLSPYAFKNLATFSASKINLANKLLGFQANANSWKSSAVDLFTQRLSTQTSASWREIRSSKSSNLDDRLFGGTTALYKSLLPSHFINKKKYAADFRFETFFHPHVSVFQKRINSDGVSGLLNIASQEPNQYLSFKDSFDPSETVRLPLPAHDVDFDPRGAYSLYNWELFFHIPLFIATRLSKEQRFEEAMTWFHYIFNPTLTSKTLPAPKCYWQVLPFRATQPERLDDMLKGLYAGAADMIAQWDDLQAHPFQPHRVARLRLIAYQKNVVMKYLDNLIAWADQLFRRDTIETINQATHLYILAQRILGLRSQRIPSRGNAIAQSFAELRELPGGLKAMNLSLVSFENDIPYSNRSTNGQSGPSTAGLLGIGRSFYFCLPKNDKLLGYWDTVSDRLFKIRHCMNIEGVVRELPLFEPPIDPALLVQAAAQGLDLGRVLADLNSPSPHYRFSTLLAKALEMAGELRALGASLLAALEKRDAEHLTNMRATHEEELLGLAKQVKQQQLNEAEEAESALRKTRDVTQKRFDFYATIEPIISEESNQLAQLARSQAFQSQAAFAESSASDIVTYTYDYSAGVAGNGPYASASIGRANVIAYYQGVSREKSHVASVYSYQANLSSILAGWKRRTNDWALQKDLAAKELIQIDRQIAAAQIRVSVAKQELDNTTRQIEQVQEIRDYRQSMFTGEELQNWMIGELSAVFFQSYQLTYDLAKKAERLSQLELGQRSSNFIRFGTWDSLHKGLLSGERLHLQLKQLEHAYLDANRREFEITKQISLDEIDPFALIELREQGYCEFSLPETLFDLDFPGHYMRRIKSVRLTIPAVASKGVHCTLTLLRNQTRLTSSVATGYSKRADEEDDRFMINWVPMQAIATSTALNDSGLFELNLRDDRRLPFEGAGAVSDWRIELPAEFRQFDYNTISTIKLDVLYSSREGGAVLKEAALANLRQQLMDETGQPQYRLFSLRYDFPSEWHRLLHAPDTNGIYRESFTIAKRLFGFPFQAGSIDITKVDLFGLPRDKGTKSATTLNSLKMLDPTNVQLNLTPAPPLGSIIHLNTDHNVEVVNPGAVGTEADWVIEINKTDREAQLSRLDDLLILFQFLVNVDSPSKR